MVKKTLLILIFIVSFSCNDKRKNGLDPKDANNLKEYLNIKSSYLHEINGFYIASSSEKPTEEHGVNTTADVIFEKSIRLFSSFLDQDNNGKLDDNYQQLSEGLAKYMTFILGHRNFVDEVSQVVQEKYDIYGMGFFSDSWPHELTYDGTGFSVNKLNSSMWRPEKFDAVWEETFHTLTEVYSRIDDDFKFTEGAKLRQYMEDDIVAGTYDISEQNTLENGNYEAFNNGEAILGGKWKLVGKEVHVDYGTTVFYRIEANGDLTTIAEIREGKREVSLKKQQTTYKKIK